MGPEYLLIFLTPFKMSCWFISLPWFLSPPNKGFKTIDNYSSVTAQEDRSFIKQTLPTHGSRPTPKESSSQPISASLFLYFLPPSLVVPVQNRTCTHHQSRKGMQMGIHSRPIDSSRLHNNRLCCACLLIIQSVIIRCICV